MTEKKKIEIMAKTFQRIQNIAEPLVDDMDSILNKLMNHYEATSAKEKKDDKSDLITYWNYRGNELPIGLNLYAQYKGKRFEAEIVSNGIKITGGPGKIPKHIFKSPSKAAIFIKKELAGAKNTAANTNGWTFFSYIDESEGSRRKRQLTHLRDEQPDFLD